MGKTTTTTIYDIAGMARVSMATGTRVLMLLIELIQKQEIKY